METGGTGGSWINCFALSVNLPLSDPSGSLPMLPPSGDAVSLVIFHFRRACELRMYSCPPRTRTTGLLGETASISAARGNRFSVSCASCQSAFEIINSPQGAFFTAVAPAASKTQKGQLFDKIKPTPPPPL